MKPIISQSKLLVFSLKTKSFMLRTKTIATFTIHPINRRHHLLERLESVIDGCNVFYLSRVSITL